MNTSSPVYSPGDSMGIKRYPSMTQVPSSWTQAVIATETARSMAIAAAVAVGAIWFLGRKK